MKWRSLELSKVLKEVPPADWEVEAMVEMVRNAANLCKSDDLMCHFLGVSESFVIHTGLHCWFWGDVLLAPLHHKAETPSHVQSLCRPSRGFVSEWGRFIPHLTIKYGHWTIGLMSFPIWRTIKYGHLNRKKNRWSTKRNPVFFEVNILETTPCLLYLADAAAMFGGVLASTWAVQGPKFAQEWIHPKGIHPTFIQRGFDQQIYIGIIRLSLIIMISFMRIWGSRFLRFMGTSVDGWWEMSMYDWLYDYQLFSWEGSLESKWSLTSVCNSHGIMGLE